MSDWIDNGYIQPRMGISAISRDDTERYYRERFILIQEELALLEAKFHEAKERIEYLEFALDEKEKENAK